MREEEDSSSSSSAGEACVAMAEIFLKPFGGESGHMTSIKRRLVGFRNKHGAFGHGRCVEALRAHMLVLFGVEPSGAGEESLGAG